MALVTLSEAKFHLRVSIDDNNVDIWAKAEEATAIVINYLKPRLIAIASISVANPTVITTSAPHSLTDGATSVIAGTTTTPTVNGAQVVTVTGPTTFTVPVNVTVGQSAAAGTVARSSWDDDTVPGDVKAAILCVLEDLYEHRPINWQGVERLVWRHRDPAFA